MAKPSREQKLEFIEKKLLTLFCFSAEENTQYLQNLQDFPIEGLDMFLKFLAEAQEQQDKFFQETVKANPEFVKAFSRFLTQTTDYIKTKFESKEKTAAESILQKID